MSDAQYDGGDNGAKAEGIVGGWIGDLDDGQAMYWYGTYSLFMGVGALLVWVVFNEIEQVRLYSNGF